MLEIVIDAVPVLVKVTTVQAIGAVTVEFPQFTELTLKAAVGRFVPVPLSEIA